jgi:hypothetical protein
MSRIRNVALAIAGAVMATSAASAASPRLLRTGGVHQGLNPGSVRKAEDLLERKAGRVPPPNTQCTELMLRNARSNSPTCCARVPARCIARPPRVVVRKSCATSATDVGPMRAAECPVSAQELGLDIPATVLARAVV